MKVIMNQNPEIPTMPESFWDKGIRKMKENPFVPGGALLTVVFLTSGFRAFAAGNKEKMQKMMRGRVVAQSFTLLAMAGSYYFTVYQPKAAEIMEARRLKALEDAPVMEKVEKKSE